MVWVVLVCTLVVILLMTAGFALVQMGRASEAEARLHYVLKQWEWDQVLGDIPTTDPSRFEGRAKDWDLSNSVEKDTYEGV